MYQNMKKPRGESSVSIIGAGIAGAWQALLFAQAGHDVTLRLLSDIRQWTFVRLFAALPLPGAGLRRADLVNRLVADIDALDNAALTALGPITSALAVGIAMTLGLAALLPVAALAYGICFLVAAAGLPVLFTALARRPGTAAVAASAALRQAVLDGVDPGQDRPAHALVGLGMDGHGPADGVGRVDHGLQLLGQEGRRLGAAGAGAVVGVDLDPVRAMGGLLAHRLDAFRRARAFLGALGQFGVGAIVARGRPVFAGRDDGAAEGRRRIEPVPGSRHGEHGRAPVV